MILRVGKTWAIRHAKFDFPELAWLRSILKSVVQHHQFRGTGHSQKSALYLALRDFASKLQAALANSMKNLSTRSSQLQHD